MQCGCVWLLPCLIVVNSHVMISVLCYFTNQYKLGVTRSRIITQLATLETIDISWGLHYWAKHMHHKCGPSCTNSWSNLCEDMSYEHHSMDEISKTSQAHQFRHSSTEKIELSTVWIINRVLWLACVLYNSGMQYPVWTDEIFI